MNNTRSITLGEELFTFTDHQNWVNLAQLFYRSSGVPSHDCVAIDAAGRICTRGLHFMRARDEGTYPIRVYDVNTKAEPTVRKCRVCGCTDNDCKGCIEKTGKPCYWTEEDLCSACVPEPQLEGAGKA